MTPAASTEELRAAYRSLARRLHPDTMSGASPAERSLAERRMREVNESWDLLRDPARRRAYDDERLGRHRPAAGSRPPRPAAAAAAGSTRSSAGDDLDLVDVGPEVHGLTGLLVRHLPWVVVLVVLGVIFVLSAYAGGGGASDPTPPVASGASTVGSCVDVSPGPSTTVVPCDGPHELRIVTRVDLPEDCPEGTEVRRLATDGRLDCVSEA